MQYTVRQCGGKSYFILHLTALASLETVRHLSYTRSAGRVAPQLENNNLHFWRAALCRHAKYSVQPEC